MNRKQILSAITISALSAILLAWAPTTAYAGADPPFGMRADVSKGFLCSVPGVNADGNLISGGLTTDTILVEANSKTGVVVLKCKLKGGVNDSGVDQEFFGFGCGVPGGVTTNTHVSVSAEGNVMMTCKLHTPQGP